MDIHALIPSPDTIPVAWGWFWFFLILTFFLHLLFMNITIGTGVISLVKSISRKEEDIKTAKDLALKLPYTIAFTITTGVAPLLFIQVLYGHFIYTSSILMAVYWLSIIILLPIAYYGAYLYDFKFESLGTFRSFIIAGAVVLFFVIAFFLSNNMTLMLIPETWKIYFSKSKGIFLNLADSTLVPRYLHFMFAALANGGLFLALLNDYRVRKGDTSFAREIRFGLKWFQIAFLIQIFLGFFFFIKLPKEIRLLFVGQDGYATVLFILALLSAFIAVYFSAKYKTRLCVAAVLFTVVNMVLIRDVVRSAYLKPYFHISNLKADPQYTPMLLFLITLIIGLGVVVYMLKLAFRAGKEV